MIDQDDMENSKPLSFSFIWGALAAVTAGRSMLGIGKIVGAPSKLG